ncbi:Bromodomain-containing protein 7 [Operophtera brumata]|uniref:Bromodomain-containing protein 7 n=1 Tax=Operophtera brumata TaxID=104452 RepID=A0A0L7L4J8_OPEBR|nr:Bromodomain-containing protein 7 [Operophtera brumata]
MDDLEKLSCKEELDLSDMENSTDDYKEPREKPKKKTTRRRREIDLLDEDETDDEGRPKKLRRHLSPGPNSPASHREPRTCVLKASQKRRPLSRLLEQLLRNLEKRDPNQFFAWPYNKHGTVYHKAAKRLLHTGLRQLTPQKLRPLGDLLTYMYEIPIKELGFDIGKMDVKVLKRSSPLKSGGSEAETVSDGTVADDRDCLKIQMEAAREQHRRRLAKKAFPRMDHEGKTTLCLATHTVSGPGGAPAAPGEEPQREDRRNIAKGVRPLTYGPFSSYAPSYDATFASLTKEESHLIYHTLLDVESLRSLSELGVDVEFLSEVEDDIAASQRDYGIAPALRHTADLIQRLYKEQWDR